MDDAARQVLKKHKSEIKKNLNLDDDILDVLEADDTITIDQVDKIKAERTNSEKISSLLFILQRKGPNAFTAFINAISPAYKFLADRLMDKYDEESKKLDRDSGNSSEESLEQGENTNPEVSHLDKEPVSPSTNVKTSLPHVGQHHSQPLQRNISNDVQRDICNDISRTNGNEITPRNNGNDITRNKGHDLPHGHLPLSHHSPRRQSNHSLDFAVHPTNHFLHTNHASRRSSHSIDFATHQSLNGMHTKLKMHLFHMNEREQSFSSPEPVTFEKVEEMLDKLLKLEQDCTKAIGATNKDSLLTSIINLKILKSELQQNLNKKEEQVQKYASKILKLETKCKNNEMTLNQQQNTIASFKIENEILKEENEKLKDDLYQKEQNDTRKTESESRVKDRNLKSISKQNEELKNQIVWYEQEFDMMRRKLSVLSHQTHNQASSVTKDALSGSEPECVKKKEMVTKHKVLDVNGNSKSTSSILQECRDLCAGSSSRSSLQHMKNKILFAESKRTVTKTPKDFKHHDRADGAELGQNHDDVNDQRSHRNGSDTAFERIAKLSANKQSVSQTNLTKLKSPVHIKKPLINKGLKKNPRWIRKPLR